MIANELRIGNIVNYKGEPIPVTMIGLHGMQSDYNNVLINAKFSTPDITPIPLSPDLLEKCGFEKAGKPYPLHSITLGCDVWLFKKSAIWIFYHNTELYKVTSGSGVREHNNIKSLHQLQNLYYVLTGSELNIKLGNKIYEQ